MSRGTLTILESETGSGKTEAALGMYFSLKEKGTVDSCYFALPTRTSAVQIHKRIEDACAKAFVTPPPVTLAVPGYLAKDTAEAGAVCRSDDFWSRDERDPRYWHIENTKRYLASLVAVGTIDQLLMSILNLRHASLRWSSFARSLIIVDEVHASDTYMGHLLEEILRRHVRRGGHALLMSATLGSSAAIRFLNRSVSPETPSHAMPSFEEAVSLPYPLIRRVNNDSSLTLRPVDPAGHRKRVTVDRQKLIDEPATVALMAAGHAKAGAKVLIIRNTVRSCVETQLELEKLLPDYMLLRIAPGVVVPHHGRYASPDRKVIDQAIEKSFGKRSSSDPIVAVGTQTIEQSLDIDCDILITDLCPMDVLLQRVGRLHRHSKPRPSGYEIPKVIILEPRHELKVNIHKPQYGIGPDRAYDHVGICELTRRSLETKREIIIPDQNRLLVESATHSDCLQQLADEDPVYASHLEQYLGKTSAIRMIANGVMTSDTWRYGDPYVKHPIKDISTTRLGEGSYAIELPPVTTFSGACIKTIAIPHWMLHIPNKDDDQTHLDLTVTKQDNSIRIDVSSSRFIYDRLGLDFLND